MRKKIGILIIISLCFVIYYLNTRNVVVYEETIKPDVISYTSVIEKNKVNISEKNRQIEVKTLNKETEEDKINILLQEVQEKYKLLENNVKNYDLTKINEKIIEIENEYNKYKTEINANENIQYNITSELESLKNNLDEILSELNLKE